MPKITREKFDEAMKLIPRAHPYEDAVLEGDVVLAYVNQLERQVAALRDELENARGYVFRGVAEGSAFAEMRINSIDALLAETDSQCPTCGDPGAFSPGTDAKHTNSFCPEYQGTGKWEKP